MKHLELRYLWIQEEVAQRRIQACKILSAENLADILTKTLARELHWRAVDALGMKTITVG